MAVALTTWSQVSLSFRVSDVRGDVLLSDVAFQRVCGLLTRTFRPFLGFTTHLVELRFRWREEFGASEESGRCSQLSSVCCLRLPQECVTFSVCFTHSFFPTVFVCPDPEWLLSGVVPGGLSPPEQAAFQFHP